MSIPEGAGRFWAATVSLIVCVSQRIRDTLRSLFLSKIGSAKLGILSALNPQCSLIITASICLVMWCILVVCVLYNTHEKEKFFLLSNVGEEAFAIWLKIRMEKKQR